MNVYNFLTIVLMVLQVFQIIMFWLVPLIYRLRLNLSIDIYISSYHRSRMLFFHVQNFCDRYIHIVSWEILSNTGESLSRVYANFDDTTSFLFTNSSIKPMSNNVFFVSDMPQCCTPSQVKVVYRVGGSLVKQVLIRQNIISLDKKLGYLTWGSLSEQDYIANVVTFLKSL